MELIQQLLIGLIMTEQFENSRHDNHEFHKFLIPAHHQWGMANK